MTPVSISRIRSPEEAYLSSEKENVGEKAGASSVVPDRAATRAAAIPTETRNSRAREIADERARRPTAAQSRGIGSDTGLAARADVCKKFLNDTAAGRAGPLEILRSAWVNASAEDRQTFLAEIGVDESDDDEPDDDGEPADGEDQCVFDTMPIGGGVIGGGPR
jgi:hypothetical protein